MSIKDYESCVIADGGVERKGLAYYYTVQTLWISHSNSYRGQYTT